MGISVVKMSLTNPHGGLKYLQRYIIRGYATYIFLMGSNTPLSPYKDISPNPENTSSSPQVTCTSFHNISLILSKNYVIMFLVLFQSLSFDVYM